MSTVCPSTQELSDYLNENPSVNGEFVESHLLNCESCKQTIEQLSDETNSGKVWSSMLGQSDHSNEDLSPVLDRIKQVVPWQQLLPKIEGYRLLELVGRGASAVVYRAEQDTPRRQVAIKMLAVPHQANEKLLTRFQTEADLVAQLAHPNIAPIFEVGSHLGAAFFTMPFYEGNSLAHQLDGTPLSSKIAARLMRDTANAIHFAHEKKVIHRDLKPGNILLKFDEPGKLQSAQPVVSDFGVAKSLHDHSNMTQTGEIVGTASYMAPEQVKASSTTIGPAADIYAMGAILYELITGRPPFKAESPTETLLQVLHHEPIAPRRIQPGLSLDIETICLKCLDKNPAQRYKTADQLAEDLNNFTNGQPIQARPIGPIRRTIKWTRRRPATAALLGLSTLATLILVAVWIGFTIQLKDQRDTILATAKQLEKEQRQTADSFARAHQAIRSYLQAVLDNPQLAKYELLPVKKELLSSGSTFYEDLLRENLDYLSDSEATSETIDLEQARLFLNLGRLHYETREYQDSLQALKLAHKVCNERFSEGSILENTRFATLSAVICISKSKLHLSLGEIPEAIETAKQGQHIFLELGKRKALDPGYQNWYLADAMQRLAAAYLEAKQHKEAYDAADKAVTFAERLIAIPDFQLTLSQSYLHRGLVSRERQESDRSLADLKAAADIIENVSLKTQPRNKRYEEPRSICLFELAIHYYREQQLDEAIDTLTKAIDCQHEIYKMQSSIDHVGLRLADMYETCSTWQLEIENSDASKLALANAKLIRSQIDRRHSGPTNLHEQIRNRIDLADALVQQHQYLDSLDQYKKALNEANSQRAISNETKYRRLAKEVHYKLAFVRFEIGSYVDCIENYEALEKLTDNMDSDDATRYAICLAVAGRAEEALNRAADIPVNVPSPNANIGQLPVVYFLSSSNRPKYTKVGIEKGKQLIHNLMEKLDDLSENQRLKFAYGLCWAASICEDPVNSIEGQQDFIDQADQDALKCLASIVENLDQGVLIRWTDDERLDRLRNTSLLAKIRKNKSSSETSDHP